MVDEGDEYECKRWVWMEKMGADARDECGWMLSM